METQHILLFEDDDDVLILRDLLNHSGMDFELIVAKTPPEFLAALDNCSPDLILSDYDILGFSGVCAFDAAASKCPQVPFIAVSGMSADDEQAKRMMAAGAPFVSKQKLGDLVEIIRDVLSDRALRIPGQKSVSHESRASLEEELKIANDKLQMANEELALLNKELETFSSAISHDLRAPVRKIAMFIQMIEERRAGDLDEKSREYLKRMRSSLDHMSEQIEDLLRFYRASCAPVKRDTVDISGMVRQLVSELQSGAPERNAEFIIPDRISINADPGLLRTVLENLLDNACKFSSTKAHARIEFGVIEEAEGPAVCFIRDNGAGFDMKYAERLFVPFQRLHADFPGTGVGLATVQRIIRKHGGRIWAEAEVDAGATFYFTLGR